MATRVNKRASFLAKVRSAASDTATSPKRVVNTKLEAMLDRMMEDAVASDSMMTFDQKMAVGGLALKLEAVRNKLTDDDYGPGFSSDEPKASIVNEEKTEE